METCPKLLQLTTTTGNPHSALVRHPGDPVDAAQSASMGESSSLSWKPTLNSLAPSRNKTRLFQLTAKKPACATRTGSDVYTCRNTKKRRLARALSPRDKALLLRTLAPCHRTQAQETLTHSGHKSTAETDVAGRVRSRSVQNRLEQAIVRHVDPAATATDSTGGRTVNLAGID